MKFQKNIKTRALLAEKDGRKDTATWGRLVNGWQCVSSSFGLKWMRGRRDEVFMKAELNRRGYKWGWIVPEYNPRPVNPPF